MSIYKDLTQLPYYLNFSMVAPPHGRTHAWNTGAGSAPRYDFGFGLSFSSFEYHDLKAKKLLGDKVSLSVQVTNTGRKASGWTKPTDEVVQVYASWAVSRSSSSSSSSSGGGGGGGGGFSGRVPVRQLVAFERLRAILPGETRPWSVVLPSARYALVDSAGDRVLPKGAVTFSVCGHQPTAASTSATGSPCVSAEVSVRTRPYVVSTRENGGERF